MTLTIAIICTLATICVIYDMVRKENGSKMVKTWRKGLMIGDEVRAYGYHYIVTGVNRETGQVSVKSLYEGHPAGYHLHELWPPEE